MYRLFQYQVFVPLLLLYPAAAFATFGIDDAVCAGMRDLTMNLCAPDNPPEEGDIEGRKACIEAVYDCVELSCRVYAICFSEIGPLPRPDHNYQLGDIRCDNYYLAQQPGGDGTDEGEPGQIAYEMEEHCGIPIPD